MKIRVFSVDEIDEMIKGLDTYDAEGKHLFRAPGEPGYIEGVSTSAGNVTDDLASAENDPEGSRYLIQGITEALARIDISLYGNQLIGECGQMLHCDPAKLASRAAEVAWERWCEGVELPISATDLREVAIEIGWGNYEYWSGTAREAGCDTDDPNQIEALFIPGEARGGIAWGTDAVWFDCADMKDLLRRWRENDLTP